MHNRTRRLSSGVLRTGGRLFDTWRAARTLCPARWQWQGVRWEGGSCVPAARAIWAPAWVPFFSPGAPLVASSTFGVVKDPYNGEPWVGVGDVERAQWQGQGWRSGAGAGSLISLRALHLHPTGSVNVSKTSQSLLTLWFGRYFWGYPLSKVEPNPCISLCVSIFKWKFA